MDDTHSGCGQGQAKISSIFFIFYSASGQFMSGVETLVKLAEWKLGSEWKSRSGQHFFPLQVSTFPGSAFLPNSVGEELSH